MTGDSPFPLIDAALRGALIALLALLAASFWRDRRLLPAARVGCLLALGLCDYAITTAPGFTSGLPLAVRVPMMAISNGNPVLFWLFARVLLDDDFRLGRGPLAGGRAGGTKGAAGVWAAWAAWGVLALLGALGCGLPPGALRTTLGPVISLVLGISPLVFGGLVIVATLRQWRGDLVEQRRRLRAFIVIGGTAYLLASTIARVVGTDDGRFAATASLIDIVALGAIVAVIAGRLLRLGPSELFRATPYQALAVGDSRAGGKDGVEGSAADDADTPATCATAEHAPPDESREATASADALPPTDTSDPAQALLAQRLAHLMDEERAYRDEDLSITRLATRLAVPEYRLRRLINQRLGHRNFSAYVNQYRLAEAMAALADPGRASLPVLTIALEAGFQSIGPFNRAFKAHTGLTPTEFRRKNSADSGNG